MIGFTKKQAIKYAVLPGLKHRINDLFMTGFQYIPFFIGLVYQSVRLLPPAHPYANPQNIGRFGIRHVLAEAASNIVISRKNIDQVVLYFTILLGLVIASIQFCLLFFSLIFQPAMAAMPGNFAGFFVTPAPAQDLAYILLDLVFGVPDMFGSCVSTNVICTDNVLQRVPASLDSGPNFANMAWPFPVHHALHQMFQLYSLGLMVVAAMIAIYFMVAVVVETAQTGQAFGKRFNKVWAPVRIVVAFGLLIPVGYGLNASQYIVLYAAKFGSGFATNGWILFNNVLDNGGDTAIPLSGATPTNLVSQPNPPEVGKFLQFMYEARVCAEFERLNSIRLATNEDGSIDNRKLIDLNGSGIGKFLGPYAARGPTFNPNFLLIDGSTTYDDFVDFANGSSQVSIRFGVRDDKKYNKEKGFVKPICGELIFNLTDPRDPVNAKNPPEPGPEIMQKYYLFAIQELWYAVLPGHPPADYAISSYTENFPRNTVINRTALNEINPIAKPLPMPNAEYGTALQDFYSSDLIAAMLDPASKGLDAYESGGELLGNKGALEAQAGHGSWTPNLDEKGWAGASLWYNKVAELNGSVSAAVLNIPTPSLKPAVMEYVIEKKNQQDRSVSINEAAKPQLADGRDIPFIRPEDSEQASALYEAFKYWQSDGQSSSTHTAPTGNAFIDAFNAFLGIDGLYSMRKNSDVHPLAQLVGIGRSLIESAIRNTVLAGGSTIAGTILGVMDQFPSELSHAAVGILMTVATIGLTAGFILFYIVPFLPFIYFFFAVGGWIKGIFEAMVGAPLWALAHVRIDGHGLPGQAAVSGYFLIFEIFIRPILIVFGLLASISIFAALVSTLNSTWDIVMANLTGYDAKTEASGLFEKAVEKIRGPIDEFFYTVVYVIVVYLFAMSSFKLIDMIPNNILRWMGQNVSIFNDMREDAAQGLVGAGSVGAQQGIQNIGGALEGSLKTTLK